MKKFFLVGIVLGILFVISCRRTTQEPDDTKYTQTPISLKIPTFFPKMDIPKDNEMTQERLSLGRKLYYDPILSNNGKACASCHFQDKGFTSDVAVGATVLPHINLGWSSNFLWKGEKNCSLEEMMLYEVNEFFITDVSKLNASDTYKKLFKKAYNIEIISSKDIAYALAQFFRTLISGNSKFDQFRRHELALNLDEQRGMELFFTEKGDCFHCHGGSLFTDNDFHNTGLDASFATGEQGRYDVTGIASDIGKYKTPTLRNCEKRTQFMHDGRFTTLEQVIDFYDHGFHKTSPNIDPLMLLPEKKDGLQLSPQDKADLVAFLKTLTDNVFLTDTTLSKP